VLIVTCPVLSELSPLSVIGRSAVLARLMASLDPAAPHSDKANQGSRQHY
jgi:hypothetical protein